MGEIGAGEIAQFFRTLADRYQKPASVFLLGASALALLGNLRPTLDIDYDVETTPEEMSDLRKVMEKLAAEQKLELEFVPIEEFIPLPESAASRHRLIGRFGELAVYVYDPYSIALSKVARGLETDIQDVLFILNEKLIALEQLEKYVQDAEPKAQQFDIEPRDLREHLAAIRQLAQR